MTETPKVHTYKVEDIFEDIPDDKENVIMNLPPEVMEEAGIKPGDKVKISIGDQGSLIIEKIKENSGEEEQNTNEQA
jgi:prophage tail gpP-like protein